MPPLVSVVMPVRNGLQAGPGYLRQAIESLINQDYEGPVEVIVVDDGSTDGTAAEVTRLADTGRLSRKLVLIERGHAGVTRSLNVGISRATGEFLARQDADDFSAPGRLTRQVQYLMANPDVAMVGSAVQVYHDSRRMQEVWYRSATERLKKEDFRKGSPLAHGSVTFRRSVFSDVGVYDEQFPHAQDYDLFWRIVKKHPVATISEALYSYRVHSQRVTSRPKQAALQRECARKIRQRIERELR